MIITRKAIPRRAVLRGLGATLALPLLDGMVPALTALRDTTAGRVNRLGVVYVPNGIMMPAWTPAVSAAVKALVAAVIGAVLERAISILDAVPVVP